MGKVTHFGILHDATPGNDYCNGQIAEESSHHPTTLCMIDCLHIEDIESMLKEKGFETPSRQIVALTICFVPNKLATPLRILFHLQTASSIRRHQRRRLLQAVHISIALGTSALKQDCEVVTVIDGNDIDRVVTQYKP